MRYNYFMSVCWLLLLPLLCPAQSASQALLLDRALFFDDPETTLAQLSPNGQYLSFVKPYQGALNIWVKKRDEPFANARPVTAGTIRPIKSYYWSADSRYLLYVQDINGDENFQLLAVDAHKPANAGQGVPQSRDIVNVKGARMQIYRIAKTDPNLLFIGLNERDKSWFDLYQVNIATGKRQLIYKNSSRITDWYFDWNDTPRAVMRSGAHSESELLSIQGSTQDSLRLRPIITHDVFEDVVVVGFHKDNERLYLMSNKGERNLRELILVNIRTGTIETLEKDPMGRVDFTSITLSEKNRLPLFVTYNDERLRRYWKDSTFARDFRSISRQLPDADIQFTSASRDERYWLLNAVRDIDPGSTYLFDRKRRQLTLQFHSRPLLPSQELVTMNSIRYPSSDGLEIPAYLSLPKGIPAKGLPLIVMPHGGPWNRTSWGFNAYHQLWANRGYAVLSPNFRASTGYGKSFMIAGNHEWGGKMQDDLTWGVTYLIKKGIVDANRVGIMGASYGGYATLAGIAFTPDRYKAAVAICAPSNLVSTINSLPTYWASTIEAWHQYVGNPGLPLDRQRLEKQSPLFSVNSIKTPLYLVHGANDPRVKRAESDQIVIALRERGFPVEYMVAPDEGHGFQRPINILAMIAKVEEFLANRLGGRYQASVSEALQKRIAEITVNTRTLTLNTPESK